MSLLFSVENVVQ